MVFNWVWKNVLGGEEECPEGSTDDNNTATAVLKQNENGSSPNITLPVDASVGESAVPETSEARNDTAHDTSGRKTKPSAASSSRSQKKPRLSEKSLNETNDAPKAVAPRMSYPFDVMYERLVNFHREKGHCRVPQNYKDDPQLASWVKNLRRNRRPGKILCGENVRKLDAIGFCWESRAGRPIGATIEAGAKSPARKFRKPFQLDEE